MAAAADTSHQTPPVDLLYAIVSGALCHIQRKQQKESHVKEGTFCTELLTTNNIHLIARTSHIIAPIIV